MTPHRRSMTNREEDDEQGAVRHHDLTGRLRRRPGPERGEPARRRRDAAARVGLPARGLARARTARRAARSTPAHAVDRGVAGQRRRRDHGAQHVRRRPRARGGDEPWSGWWGDDPPFHYPVFVLTHHPREPLEMEGGTTFTFVTEGIESALEQARGAPADKDVLLGGGAERRPAVPRRGAGRRDRAPRRPRPARRRRAALRRTPAPELEQVRAIEAPEVTHLKYRSD